jgi:hypothetical protein
VDVEFAEANAVEKRMHEHLNVPSDEDVRHDENAVERTPLTLRDLYSLLYQVEQDVLEIRHAFLLVLLARDVQGAVGYDLGKREGTLRKIQLGSASTRRASSP